MQQLDYDHTHFEQGNNAGDQALLVKFFNKPVQDQAATQEQGRPVFKDVCYVDIRTVGSKNGYVCRPARQDDKNRFPRHYKAFLDRVEMPLEGTPLAEWTLISRSQAEEMAYLGVKTVEQLASVSDANIGVIMGGFALKAKATEWLEAAKKNGSDPKVAQALEDAKAEAAQQKARADLLEERLNKLESMLEAPKQKIKGMSADAFILDDVEEAMGENQVSSLEDEPEAPEPVKTTSRRRRK